MQTFKYIFQNFQISRIWIRGFYLLFSSKLAIWCRLIIQVIFIFHFMYSMVPNNSAAHLLNFKNFSLPTRLIWTFTLIKFQEKKPTYTVIMHLHVYWFFSFFGCLEIFGDPKIHRNWNIYEGKLRSSKRGVFQTFWKTDSCPIFCF